MASASREQSQGIEQINTAVSQMDKVTQSNAASAEESASASEELNAQAGALKEAIEALRQLVGAQQLGRIPGAQAGERKPASRPFSKPAHRWEQGLMVHAGGNGGRGGLAVGAEDDFRDLKEH